MVYWYCMKRFFKPTRAKIILTLLLPVYIGIEIGVEKTLLDAPTTYDLSLLPLPYIVALFMIAGLWIIPIEDTSFNWPLFSTGQKITSFLFELIIPLIVSYVIACIVVCMYRKYKKRKQTLKETDQPFGSDE